MRRSVLAGMVIWVLGWGAVAQASESRAQALLYNLSFENMTDIFLFPNLLPEYEGLYFHLPGAIPNIYGGLVYNFSADSALGVFVHRPLVDAFEQYRMNVNSITGADGIYFNASQPLENRYPGQILDLMYGTGKWGVGLRLHVWSEVSNQEPPLADAADTASTITAELNTGFRLSDGFNLRGNVAFRNVAESYFLLVFRVGGRYLSPEKKRMRPVLASELQFALISPETGDSSFAFMLPFKGGVRFEAIPDVLYLGLLAGLDLQMYKPGGGDTAFGLMIPGVEAAVEWMVLSWLQVRASMKGGYAVQFAGDPADNMPKREQAIFSSGLGIPLGPLSIDAVIQYSLWQDGPYFIGGRAGLFAGVSLSYNWGEVATKPAPAPVETPAAKPAAKPAPKEEKPAATEEKKPEFENW